MHAHKQRNIANKSIVIYNRDVGDILINNEHKTSTHTQILNFANSVHSNLKLILTQELDAKVSKIFSYTEHSRIWNRYLQKTSFYRYGHSFYPQ
jgi:hypothetical protein